MSPPALQWMPPGENGVYELRLGEEIVGRVRPLRAPGGIVGYWWDAASEERDIPLQCSLLIERHYKTARGAQKACEAYVQGHLPRPAEDLDAQVRALAPSWANLKE